MDIDLMDIDSDEPVSLLNIDTLDTCKSNESLRRAAILHKILLTYTHPLNKNH